MVSASLKGKEKAVEPIEHDSDSDSDSDSDLSSSTSHDSDSDSEPITQEYLDSLLEKARKSATSAAVAGSSSGLLEDDLTRLDDEPVDLPLPPLNPGKVPLPYFQPDGKLRDPDIELAEKLSEQYTVPAPPIQPPELSKSGKPLTKKEIKAAKQVTAGASWFDMPAPAEADLPRLHREVEAMRLHNQLDPKRFYRKDEGEGKGIKGLPKFFAIGTIVAEKQPFGGASSDNLTRANRKRTFVDELVDDAEAKRYAKKKFDEMQAIKGARGKNTLKAKQRRVKW